MRTSIRDIRTRLRYLSEEVPSKARFKYIEERARDNIERKAINQAIKTLELGVKNNCIYENTVFDLFDFICENGFDGQINYASSLIINEWVQRARDAGEASKYIHQKMGRIKAKLNPEVNAVGDAMAKLKNALQPPTVTIDAPKVEVPSVGGAAPKKATTEAYEAIAEALDTVVQCDRIVNNYNTFSKRFNIDKTILENVTISSVENTVVKICQLMDTYSIDDRRKYSMAMENAWYGFHKNGIPVTESEIVTPATDYFLAKGNNNSMCRDILENSLVVEPKDYKGDMEVITEEEPEDDEFFEEASRKIKKNDKGETVPETCECGGKIAIVFAGEPIFKCKECGKYYGTVPFNEGKLQTSDRDKLDSSSFGIPSLRKYPLNDKSHIKAAVRMFNHVDSSHEAELAKNLKAAIKREGLDGEISVGKDNRFSKYYKPALKEMANGEIEYEDIKALQTTIKNVTENPDSFTKAFNVIKVNNTPHKEQQLAVLIPLIFEENEHNIVTHSAQLLCYISGILLPSPDIDLDATNDIIDKLEHGFMNSGLEHSTIKSFAAQVKEELEILWKIIDNFEEGVGEQYKLYTNRLLKMYNSLDGYTVPADATPVDAQSMDENSILYIPIMWNLLEQRMVFEEDFFDADRLAIILNKAPVLAESLVEFSKLCPEVIDPSYLNEALSTVVSRMDSKFRVGSFDRYNLRTALKESAKTDDIDKKYEDIDREIDAVEEITRLQAGNDVLEVMHLLYQEAAYSSITESSFKNNILLAKEKLKHNIQKLSDKEKAISKSIDVASNNFIKGIEKALTNDNREAVIKGSIMPSASKTLKLGLAGLMAGGVGAGVGHATGAALLGPAMAAIPILGYVGVNKHFKNRERQAVIDELEIELKMVQEYIDLAKSKNDLQALRQCLTIQKELERARQRVKYKMAVSTGRKLHSTDTTLQDLD